MQGIPPLRPYRGLCSDPALEYLSSANLVGYFRNVPISAGVFLSTGSEYRPLQPGRCFDGDGTNDGITFTTAIVLDDDFEIELNINADDVTGRHIVANTVASAQARLALDASGFLTIYNDSAVVTTFSGFTFATGTDYKVSLVRTGTSATLTVNETLEDTQTSSGTVTLNSAMLVRGAATSWTTFDGKMWGLKIYKAGVLQVFYKMDDASGLEARDSSGLENNGVISGVVSSFYATQTVYSYQNNLGYTEGTGSNGAAVGVFIPRNEAIPTQDTEGNTLQYNGKAKMIAIPRLNSCGTFDGINDKITFSSLTGGTTIVSYEGTSTPTIDTGANEITVTAGTLYNVLLSDGTHIPFSEGAGETVADVVNGNDGTIVNANLTTFWGTTQNTYRYNATVGFSKYMYYDGTGNYITVAGMTASADYFGACIIGNKVFVSDPSSTRVLFALGNSAYRAYTSGGTWFLNNGTNTGISVVAGYNKVSVEFNSSGEAIALSINEVEVWTGAAPAGTASTVFYIGARNGGSVGLFWKDTIWDFAVTGSSVKNFAFDGYGATNADWLDTTGGGSNGVVNGSPIPLRIPKLTGADTDVYGQTLRNPPLPTHNDSEGSIDYRLIGEGDVVIPETFHLPSSMETIEFEEAVSNPVYKKDGVELRYYDATLDAGDNTQVTNCLS
jgi:hypothetical protein